jgi:hypothetical protein
MKSALLAAFLLSFILLAGCMQQEAPTAPPKAAPPVIVPQERLASVAIIRAPEGLVDEGTRFSIIWYVSSEPVSQANYTSLRYDLSSKAGEAPAFDAYPLSTPPQKGTVPGTFSAEMVAGEKDVYFRAYAMVDGKGYWTNESVVRVRPIPLNLSITITNAPSEINANQGFYVNWTVQGSKPKVLDSMELRYGSQSGADAGATAYPESRMILDGEAPGAYGVYFEPFKTQGIVYFRVHVRAENHDYWSEEFSIRIVQLGLFGAGY